MGPGSSYLEKIAKEKGTHKEPLGLKSTLPFNIRLCSLFCLLGFLRGRGLLIVSKSNIQSKICFQKDRNSL
jgi:hypothetical protein